jgi:catechol 2,3-dioxygenase-like lactoylglutathione lyase family enzyme
MPCNSRFWAQEEICVGVKDIERAKAWYIDKLGLYMRANSNRAVYLTSSCRGEVSLELFPLSAKVSGNHPCTHPVLFARELDAMHSAFRASGVTVGTIQSDARGNRFFLFRDLDGNTLEMCADTR